MLGEVAQIQGGIQKQSKRAPRENHFPFLRVANVTAKGLDLSEIHQIELFGDELNRLRLQRGDLLVVEGNGSPTQIGRAAIWNGAVADCVHQNHLIRVRAGSVVLPEYLHLYWNSPANRDFLTAVSSSTSGLHTLSVRKLQQVEVPVPPLEEQQRIVAILDDHLSRLDAAQCSLAENLQRLSILRSAVLNGLREDAETHGSLVPIGDVADVISGPAFKSSEFLVEGRLRLLRGDNIEPGALRWSKARYWPESLIPGYEHLLVSEGDLILAMDRPVISTGLKLARVSAGDLPALLVQRVARIRTSAEVTSDYLFHMLSESGFQSALLSGQVGTQLPHITLKSIKEYQVPVPTPTVQMELVGATRATLELIERLEGSLRSGLARSAALRRSLLRAAFAGELTSGHEPEEGVA